MMLEKIHINIRRSLLVFSLVFITSTLSVAFSFAYLDGVNADEDKIKNSMRIWKNKIGNAKKNNQTIVEKETLYLNLINDGIVGEENRLSWFEALQSTASRRGLDVFRYSTISQVKVIPKELDPAYKSIDIYKSIMKLDMKISHEGDIFAVFNDLDANAKGLYSVNYCSFEKAIIKKTLSEEASFEMKASCELSWYTFKPVEKKGLI